MRGDVRGNTALLFTAEQSYRDSVIAVAQARRIAWKR
jgi:hypothetical protein